jgi:hypothetical protein
VGVGYSNAELVVRALVGEPDQLNAGIGIGIDQITVRRTVGRTATRSSHFSQAISLKQYSRTNLTSYD